MKSMTPHGITGLERVEKNRGYSKLNKETLDGILWSTGFGRACGPTYCLSAGVINKIVYSF
jgi:hypothetical protein